MLQPRSTIGYGQPVAPIVGVSVSSDIDPPIKISKAGPKRRNVSLASTVFESEEEASDAKQTIERRDTSKTVFEGEEGNDEYDEANAVMEDDATDHETNARLFSMY